MLNKTAYESYKGESSKHVNDIMRHANALLDATADQADEQIKKVRARLQDAMGMAKDRFSDMGDMLDDTMDSAARMVQDKPYYVLGGTFVVGLLLGWFLSRK